MRDIGPLRCTACDQLVRIDFDPDDGRPVYHCRCRNAKVELSLDLIDDSPGGALKAWRADP